MPVTEMDAVEYAKGDGARAPGRVPRQLIVREEHQRIAPAWRTDVSGMRSPTDCGRRA
jgi:hypothetical protein